MAVSSFFSPERRMGHKCLPTIPVEIYMIIFDELRYDPEDMAIADTKSVLANLALVCRLFSSLSLPKLFAKFVFEGRQTGTYLHAPLNKERACPLWLERISAGDETACSLGSFVKELSFRDWIPVRTVPPHPASPDLPLSRYVRIVPRFENLRRLELLCIPITQQFFEAVGTLQKLRTLCIKDCDFGVADGAITLLDTSAPCLTELEVGQVDNIRPYVPALARLAGTRALRSLQTTVWAVARAIMETQIEIALERLEVPLVPTDATILAGFLDRTPSLLDLAIMDASEGGRPCLSLRKTSLPNLRHLRCPPQLLPALVQDRALLLQQLNLMEIDDWIYPRPHTNQGLLTPLKDRSLRTLHVPACLYRTHPLDEHLSRVEELAICFPVPMHSLDCEQLVTTICFAKRRSLGVRRLELRFAMPVRWMLDLEFQHRVVTGRLASAFPTATQFVISDSLEWHRDAGTAWRPVVPAREYFRSAVLMNADTGYPMKMSDFDGALAALFRDDEEMSLLVHRRCGERACG